MSGMKLKVMVTLRCNKDGRNEIEGNGNGKGNRNRNRNGDEQSIDNGD